MSKAFFRFMEWYQKLDKMTIDLLSRVFMKGLATGDLNKFLKEMCSRELGGPPPPTEPTIESLPPTVR